MSLRGISPFRRAYWIWSAGVRNLAARSRRLHGSRRVMSFPACGHVRIECTPDFSGSGFAALAATASHGLQIDAVEQHEQVRRRGSFAFAH
jgi:hypothetical protein